jgi:hypothetical protein
MFRRVVHKYVYTSASQPFCRELMDRMGHDSETSGNDLPARQ